jgi:hypothetical protein
MKSNKLSFERRVLAVPSCDDAPVLVRSEAYAEFSGWLDAELRKLVASWLPVTIGRRTSGPSERP